MITCGACEPLHASQGDREHVPSFVLAVVYLRPARAVLRGMLSPQRGKRAQRCGNRSRSPPSSSNAR
jgi:hypothetical protein